MTNDNTWPQILRKEKYWVLAAAGGFGLMMMANYMNIPKDNQIEGKNLECITNSFHLSTYPTIDTNLKYQLNFELKQAY